VGEAAQARRGPALGLALALLAGLALSACEPGARANEAPRRAETPTGRPTPSGLPVPRYVSLKFGEVNARAGPGDDYRLLWTYRARGLPLQVIAETDEWRRICDPEGQVAWVHQRTVDNGRRTVMRTSPAPLPLHSRPNARSREVAELSGRSIAALETCKGGWCRIASGRTKGWVPAAEVWGTADPQQCRAPRPHPQVGG
jgi:SH3-like domain-containing protein